MATVNIYTYFNAEQVSALCIHAKQGTRSMLHYLRDNYSNDFNDLVYAIADCMPWMVAEEKIISRGKNKGQRRVAFRDMNNVADRVCEELTGVSFMEFIAAKRYCSGKTMTEVALSDDDNIPYSKHWIWAFFNEYQKLDNLKQHYRKMTIKNVANTKKVIHKFMTKHKLELNEVMTWDDNKYNEWHFSQ